MNILATDDDAVVGINRYPMPSYPRGWHVIAVSNEIKPGEVKTYHYLGQDIVIFRGESGKLGVFKPFCPHLGTHFGVGGRVKGDNIICPFHSWEYNSEGQCKHIPYADKDRIPTNAKAQIWRHQETAGLIAVYYHGKEELPPEDAIPPSPIPPEFTQNEWSDTKTVAPVKIRTHVQELAENSVDLGHFQPVHGMGNPGCEIVEYNENSMFFKQQFNHTLYGIWLKYQVNVEQKGANNAVIRVEFGKVFIIIMLCNTPIDEEHIHTRTVVAIKHPASPILRSAIFMFAFWYVRRELKKDIPIWENKKYREKPVLCHTDGAIHELRKWVKQFY